MIPNLQERILTSRAEDIYFKLKEYNDAANLFAFTPATNSEPMHRCQMKCSELSGLADNYLIIKIPKNDKPDAKGEKTENEKLQEHLKNVKNFIGLKYESLNVNKDTDELAEAQKEALRLYSEYDRLLLFSGILK